MYELQTKWEKRATVRSRPRIVFDSQESGYFFPLSHQALSVHPSVAELNPEALEFLLIQSFYKYSNDIATIETRVVNEAILSVTTDALSVSFTKEQKLSLYTIMVDEAYHAYVAFDARLQIEEFTAVKPLALPKTIEIELALQWAHENLKTEYHLIFNLMAVCLAENTLTKEIVTMVDKNETHPFFQKIIKDHLSDESRHSGVFFEVLTYLWTQLDADCKQAIAGILPGFLERYLGVSVQTEFDQRTLMAMGLSKALAKKALEDTYSGFKLGKQHPLLKNILWQLERSGVMDDVVLPVFKQKGWA